MDNLEFQNQLCRQCLDILDDTSFALAGSGALRAHGLTNRESHDLDFFTVPAERGSVVDIAGYLVERLNELGYSAELLRSGKAFAKVTVVKDSMCCDIDLGADYRNHSCSITRLGRTIDESDAVANKVDALFSRAESRDLLDFASILDSGYTLEELLNLAAESNPGFDANEFVRCLIPLCSREPYDYPTYTFSSESIASSRVIIEKALNEYLHKTDKLDDIESCYKEVSMFNQDPHSSVKSNRSNDGR